MTEPKWVQAKVHMNEVCECTHERMYHSGLYASPLPNLEDYIGGCRHTHTRIEDGKKGLYVCSCPAFTLDNFKWIETHAGKEMPQGS